MSKLTSSFEFIVEAANLRPSPLNTVVNILARRLPANVVLLASISLIFGSTCVRKADIARDAPGVDSESSTRVAIRLSIFISTFSMEISLIREPI